MVIWCSSMNFSIGDYLKNPVYVQLTLIYNFTGSTGHALISFNKNNHQKGKFHLPAHVRGLPLQNVLGERWWLQLVLIEGQLVNHHGLTVGARETHNWMSRSRRLREWVKTSVKVYVWCWRTAEFWHYSTRWDQSMCHKHTSCSIR